MTNLKHIIRGMIYTRKLKGGTLEQQKKLLKQYKSYFKKDPANKCFQDSIFGLECIIQMWNEVTL